jgi:hypothetical protein
MHFNFNFGFGLKKIYLKAPKIVYSKYKNFVLINIMWDIQIVVD